MEKSTITPGRARRAVASLAVLTVLAACAGPDDDAPAADARASSPDHAAANGEAGAPDEAGLNGASYRPGPPVADPGSSRAGPSPAEEPSRAGQVAVDSLGFTRGRADAPVRIVEFSDFGCGYCRQFHEEAWPVLHRDYVETGKVQWKMIPFDVGMFPHARQAVLTGECAGEQGRFEDVRERLFEEQRTWKGGSRSQALDLFRDIARDEDLDMDRFNRCMGQGWRAARVDASNALARQLGVRGTPTFYILGMGIIPGALPAQDFADVLDRALAARAAEAGS
ncbi:MAG: DsbA family protein [Gemmatimonadetes bacterium]|nr:DsbA family protein [Gemmatimonadota bacterium]